MNFIIAKNEMRLKQGKGDPSGVKKCLRQHNIKPNIIIRYVGKSFSRNVSSCWCFVLSKRKAFNIFGQKL